MPEALPPLRRHRDCGRPVQVSPSMPRRLDFQDDHRALASLAKTHCHPHNSKRVLVRHSRDCRTPWPRGAWSQGPASYDLALWPYSSDLDHGRGYCCHHSREKFEIECVHGISMTMVMGISKIRCI